MLGKGVFNEESSTSVSSGREDFHEIMETSHKNGAPPQFEFMKKKLFARLSVDSDVIEQDILANKASCQCSGNIRGRFPTCLAKYNAKFSSDTGLDYSASIEIVQELRSPLVYNDEDSTGRFISMCMGEFSLIFTAITSSFFFNISNQFVIIRL